MLLAAEDPPSAGRPRGPARVGEACSLAAVFTVLALRYWLTVFPRATLEIRRLRAHAGAIPDPLHRRLAFAALAKQSNLEGAAAFAALVPRSARASATRALVAFQSIYNYADILAEQPLTDEDGGAAARAHAALLMALSPLAESPQTEAAEAQAPDRTYLLAQVQSCRRALAALPCAHRVIAPALIAATDIWAFQTRSSGGPGGFESWARSRPSEPGGMSWWESAGAAGSSLTVHALIAAAGQPTLDADTVDALVAAYGGPIGALHSLLDSLIDESEDARTGQASLIGFYPSRTVAAQAMGEIARRARGAARRLSQGRAHTVLLAAMASLYLSDPAARAPRATPITRAVRSAIGILLTPALAVFALRRASATLPRARRRAGVMSARPFDAEQPAEARVR